MRSSGLRIMNRRQFIKTTAVAAATTGPFLALSGKAAPSERVRIGFIGCGGRARQMIPMFKSFADIDIVAVSDVIEPRMDQAVELPAQRANVQKAQRALEYERLLSR